MTQRNFDDEEDDDFPEWADRVKANVAGEVRRRRKEMGWSAQQLADRCAELGHPIPRNVIANMESGRRANLPLVDVMILAVALYTSPICLIFPVGYVEDTQEYPFQHLLPTWEAMRRFTGESRYGEGDAGLIPEFNRHATLELTIKAARDEERLAAFAVRTATTSSQREEAERKRAEYADRADSATNELLWLRESIRREKGAVPPRLPLGLEDIEDPEPTPDTTEENAL
ncbi:helix-turn-helix domain-containing protein [Streptomyces narbonensis]|uniref:helix-turn-helix domain-containing protein n=1 Tax=Streptomyces narbonensis TaxID=67333 RepID=UPI001679A043|nr:helix-turn-helix transcriptional regulator [Streptomyces narbonensis]GGV98008.1 hypothetical protein GCM10010230_20430 [Streptomyces narbonensis]